MEHWLYALMCLSILGGISLLLMLFKFHYGFIITFFFHGSLFIAVTVWETDLWNPVGGTCSGGTWNWHWGLWGLLYMFLIPLTFLCMFVYAQSREADYKMFGKYYTHEALLFLMLIIGNWCTFGPIEDFGCYVIWGLEHFQAYAPLFHQDRFLWGIPTLYYLMIPGIIMQVLAFWLSRQLKMRRIKSRMT